MDRHTIILEQRLKKILEQHGERNYYIYPFGDAGKVAKSILNIEYDVKEAGIIDNRVAQNHPDRVYSLDGIENTDLVNVIILLISYNFKIHDELIKQIEKISSGAKVIDVFEDEYKEYLKYKNLERANRTRGVQLWTEQWSRDRCSYGI